MLKTDDLDPDGVKIVVNWENMIVNASVFIPCINVEKAKNQIYKITKTKNWEITIRATIENNKFGLRIWRMT